METRQNGGKPPLFFYVFTVAGVNCHFDGLAAFTLGEHTGICNSRHLGCMGPPVDSVTPARGYLHSEKYMLAFSVSLKHVTNCFEKNLGKVLTKYSL
jgi:hypothetical protein